MNMTREHTMTYDGRWHAQGLRWVAGLLESAAEYLESTVHEAGDDAAALNCVEEVRLRAHLRGLQ
jgi:hypothetical protein